MKNKSVKLCPETNILDSSILQGEIDLFDEGLIDSMMIVSIVLYCNQKFSCDFNDDINFEKTIRTINGISSYICNNSK